MRELLGSKTNFNKVRYPSKPISKEKALLARRKHSGRSFEEALKIIKANSTK